MSHLTHFSSPISSAQEYSALRAIVLWSTQAKVTSRFSFFGCIFVSRKFGNCCGRNTRIAWPRRTHTHNKYKLDLCTSSFNLVIFNDRMEFINDSSMAWTDNNKHNHNTCKLKQPIATYCRPKQIMSRATKSPHRNQHIAVSNLCLLFQTSKCWVSKRPSLSCRKNLSCDAYMRNFYDTVVIVSLFLCICVNNVNVGVMCVIVSLTCWALGQTCRGYSFGENSNK